jgi:hypothetical protein
LVSAATATAAALVVGVEPPPESVQPATAEPVDLAAATRLLPNASEVPDVTGGLGAAVYDGNQAVLDQLIRAVVNGISLTAFAQASGIDPKSLVNTLLANIPASLLPGILDALAVDLPVLDRVLGQLGSGVAELLSSVLGEIGVDAITDQTLTGVLALLGLDLSDPLNLSNLAVPEVNIVTAGPSFAVLKMLGLDLGWTPALPNSVADGINGTAYLELGAAGVLKLLAGKLAVGPDPLGLVGALNGLISDIAEDPMLSQLPDVLHVRVIPTVSVGLGAFAAAMSYEKVLEQLQYQPGGSEYAGTDPALGSLTLLPLVLINNPARPDGGAAARFGSLAALFGINTVNPTTQATNSGSGIGVLGSGVALGAANVLPVLVDVSYEYQPLSDLASWPNPFTLVNNLAAGLSPTYMLRGLSAESVAGLTDQLTTQLGTARLAGGPLSLNLYLTLHSATLPMLEPLYLASDFLNAAGLHPLAQLPMRLANALAPALTTLVNIGYANVTRQPDGTYTRNFNEAGTETPFMSLPNLDYGLVIRDVIDQLIRGFTKEFFSNNPTTTTPNVLTNLLNGPSGLPSADPELLRVASSNDEKESPKDSAHDDASSLKKTVAEHVSTTDGDQPVTPNVAEKETPGGTDEAGAAGAPEDDQAPTNPPEKVKPPRHAKPEGGLAPVDGRSHAPRHAKPAAGSEQTGDGVATTTPKHAKPRINEARDTANAFSPKGDKPERRPGRHAQKHDESSPSTAGPAEGDSEDKAADKAA